MNKKGTTRANVVVLKQILNLIPIGLINRHARETGVDAKARTFSVLSYLSAMLFAQSYETASGRFRVIGVLNDA